MTQKIVIDPITRIEGHAKITIEMDDQGFVRDAHFHITQFRGFEKLVEGRPFHEMPSLMARICGICPVSHLVASARACDMILAVHVPETAINLRRILNLAQLIQSHALSFFYLSSPDLLLGMDADVAKRNIFGVIQSNPQLARDGIRLRQFGQQVIEWLAGKRIHPAWVVPGGVSAPLSAENREKILAAIPEALATIQRTLDWYKGVLDNFREEARLFGNMPTMFMGLVSPDGELEHLRGKLRIVDAVGNIVADGLEPEHYQDYLGEAAESWTYLKSPYYKPMGYPNGMYRVGPLARLNIINRCGTPYADQEWAEFRQLERGAVLSSFHYHYSRLIEILYGIERIEQILNHPDILSKKVRAFAGPNKLEGIGMSEAPRGTLMHHYKIDENGLVQWVNLIIATGHNNLAMNRSVLQVAKHYVKGEKIQEGMLNRVEAVIRTYDPCLSCSTHAAGQMPLNIELINSGGEVIDQVIRG
ncbi:MAG: Ni/Fe hydrogenase subunit alpha [Anaerolinea sp.]|nr:Ni/Fe hydrogenase subunit alpha [Anaerolinea sp.]MCC6975613.1 Ni/Fe hydrogenase subunit alpha [Anaerolineae bacterium]CAG0949881.1 hydrogenase, group IIId [Anaerolineae bacterium]